MAIPKGIDKKTINSLINSGYFDSEISESDFFEFPNPLDHYKGKTVDVVLSHGLYDSIYSGTLKSILLTGIGIEGTGVGHTSIAQEMKGFLAFLPDILTGKISLSDSPTMGTIISYPEIDQILLSEGDKQEVIFAHVRGSFLRGVPDKYYIKTK